MDHWLRAVWEPRLEGKPYLPGVVPSRPVRTVPFRGRAGGVVFMQWRNPWSEVFRNEGGNGPARVSAVAAAALLQMSPSQAQRRRIVTFRRGAAEAEAAGKGGAAPRGGEDAVLEAVAQPWRRFWLRFAAALFLNTVCLMLGLPEPPLGPPLLLVD